MDDLFNLDPNEQREGKVTAWALSWFPKDEWSRAVELWPELLAKIPEDHAHYSFWVELNLRVAAKTQPGTPDVAPLYVDALIEQFGEDAGKAESRASMGAALARSGNAKSWPPGRNDPCWCESGKKYKRCCLRATWTESHA